MEVLETMTLVLIILGVMTSNVVTRLLYRSNTAVISPGLT